MSRKGPQIGMIAVCFACWGMLDFVEDIGFDGSLHFLFLCLFVYNVLCISNL